MDNYNAIEASLAETLKPTNGYYYNRAGYNINYTLDVMQVMFAAIMLSSKEDESIENTASRLNIDILMPKDNNAWFDDIQKAIAESNKGPYYMIVHDPEINHFSTIIFDKDEDGKPVVTFFDGLGKGRFDKDEPSTVFRTPLRFQQQIKQKIEELLPKATFKDESEQVQTAQCCGLTTACVIADHQKRLNRDYKKSPLLTTADHIGYKALGEKVFAAIEIASKDKHKPIIHQQIMSDEALAFEFAAEEFKYAGLSTPNSKEAIIKSQADEFKRISDKSTGGPSR